MLNLDTGIRAALTEQIIQHLEEFVPNSLASLRGSLAEGCADAYSDIDLLWEVPGVLFPGSLAKLPEVLALVAPVESFRLDPDYQGSSQRRLIFARFEGLPLFWRLDLLILANPANTDETYIENKAAAKIITDWAWSESALANCVAAIKNHLRNQDAEALALLIRAYERVNQPFPQEESLLVLILQLASHLEKQEPALVNLAKRVQILAREFIG